MFDMQMKMTLTASLFFLAGCASMDQPINSNYGAAMAEIENLHIVNPQATPGAPTANASKTTDAIQRYLDDAVKEPVLAEGSE